MAEAIDHVLEACRPDNGERWSDQIKELAAFNATPTPTHPIPPPPILKVQRATAEQEFQAHCRRSTMSARMRMACRG